MPTLDCCRRADPYRRRIYVPHLEGGFTLIEMLVVIALVSLLAGMVAPRFATALKRAEYASQRASVLGQIDNLGYRAYLLGTEIVLDSAAKTAPDGQHLLALPEGWSVKAARPIVYDAWGACSGGRIELRAADGHAESFDLNPPACRTGGALQQG